MIATRQLLVRQVNLEQFPDVDEAHLAGLNAHVTIGDLHGNALKLIFTLIKHGVMTNLTKQHYCSLLSLLSVRSAFKPESFDKAALCEFNSIINQATCKKGAMIRLVGDILADRGPCDYFMLKLLDKLVKSGVNLEILISNHDYEFIAGCEKCYLEKPTPAKITYELSSTFVRSLCNLNTLFEKEIVTFDEIWQLYQAAYLPNLKALSYSLDEAKNELTIYTHAPNDLATVQNIAKKLNVTYRDTTMQELAMTIEEINLKFKSYAEKNKISDLFDRKAVYTILDGKQFCDETFSVADHPFEQLTNNRSHNSLSRPDKATNGNYSLCFVFGHDRDWLDSEHVICLDTKLGAYYWNPWADDGNTLISNSIGTYKALYSLGAQLKLNLEKGVSQEQEAVSIKAQALS